MNIQKIGPSKVIMSNPDSKHRYFGWPTAARLQNGRIAVVASGFRLRHVCPFGKTVISYSEDDGETYTFPAPVIDTPLDDRDGGITPFGEHSVIVTSFNNTLAYQRSKTYASPYALAYLDTVTPEEEERYLGPTFRISHDGGVTFGALHKAPITSPHGPLEMPDGSLLWVGTRFVARFSSMTGKDSICAYRIDRDGNCTYVGEIDDIYDENGVLQMSCEPHAIRLEDGTILVHIRVEKKQEMGSLAFTLFQSESHDDGKTWSKPHPILPNLGGAPAHLFRHSSGMLLCTYSYREEPYGIRVMFSRDNGKTWDTGNYELYRGVGWDLGYPSTVELADGSMITVFYAWPNEDTPAVIMQQKWTFEE